MISKQKQQYDKSRRKIDPHTKTGIKLSVYNRERLAKYRTTHKEETRVYMVEYRKNNKARKAELEKKYYEQMCIEFDKSLFQVKMALKAWSMRVRELDNEMCKNCSSTEELNAHHIYACSTHPEKALDINNGVTLCRACHKNAHGGVFR